MKERMYRFVAWMALAIVISAAIIGFSLNAAMAAQGEEQKADESGTSDKVLMSFAVAAVTIGASWSAAYAVAKVGSAAMGAISENPELAGRSLAFVGLAEGIAIFGLIVAIMLLGKM